MIRICAPDKHIAGRNATLGGLGTGGRRMRGGYGGNRSFLCDVSLAFVSMMVFFAEGKAGHAGKNVNLCCDR